MNNGEPERLLVLVVLFVLDLLPLLRLLGRRRGLLVSLLVAVVVVPEAAVALLERVELVSVAVRLQNVLGFLE